MKEPELRKHAECSICRKKIGHTGLPCFWIIKIERHGLALKDIARQDGLAALLQSPFLAQAMGPDNDLTIPLMEPLTVTLCESCALDDISILRLRETVDVQ